METPKIKTRVVHSQSKTAWNVISEKIGEKYKIARVPYIVVDDSEFLTTKYKYEALVHAQFISDCFNNSEKIANVIFWSER
jgi:hypothetical protein